MFSNTLFFIPNSQLDYIPKPSLQLDWAMWLLANGIGYLLESSMSFVLSLSYAEYPMEDSRTLEDSRDTPGSLNDWMELNGTKTHPNSLPDCNVT